ncbi:hypothetical protein FBY35_2611 [Streptomyces sp. SLBN-118]|uniref:hypothetical protein n=1 Tax=Streptomyces sp. SLBN-118 TaxID=2768454 RepID=UPI001154F650|nr:hypothetical protein [Streptomyces sp. SLBN-118]TQK52184.1 hypothetical protein FBY35_2611 [Streptomyces sp. SLBN-118]
MTRYGHQGAHEERRGAALLALVRAWAAGVVVLVFSEYLWATLVRDVPATGPRMETFGGRLLLAHVPNAVCIATAVWAAARIHREPFRDSVPGHLTAAFAVPVVALALNMAVRRQELAAEGVLLSNAVLVVGCVAGYAADRLQDEA